MDVQFVTGADDRMFLQTLILLQSFANAGAAGAIKVCDFGFTPGQQNFLKAHDLLLSADVHITQNHEHPWYRKAWYRKAALAQFISRDVDVSVWLDADVIVTGDPRAEVMALVSEMRRGGAVIAACQDANGLDLDEFCRHWAANGISTAPFVQLLQRSGVAPHYPYLNSGVFVATTHDWLMEWKKSTFDLDPHILFEQNAFNAVAWLAPECVRILDRRRWNLHGADLDRISIGADLGSLRCDDQAVMVVHATSAYDRHVRNLQLNAMLGNKQIPVQLKVFCHPGLQIRQLALLDQYIAAHGAELAKYL